MVAGSSYIPKDNPANPSGEDAHFFCRKAQVIGIADGVGSWAEKGVDAGAYARGLMRNAAHFVKSKLPAPVDPKSVLDYAFAETAELGSSTACIISLDGNRLRAVNVGDSGFMVIREGETIFRSPVQQYRFNCPYQLERKSPHGLAKAKKMAVEVEIGDVVVVGTDGLFDNMFPDEVAMTVEQCFNEGMSPAMVASELATAARRILMERETVTPFEVASGKAGVARRGGKIDDITVVVAYVVPFD